MKWYRADIKAKKIESICMMNISISNLNSNRIEFLKK